MRIAKDSPAEVKEQAFARLMAMHESGIYEPVDKTAEITFNTEWQLTDYGRRLSAEADERDEPFSAKGMRVLVVSGSELVDIAARAAGDGVKPNAARWYRQLHEAIMKAIDSGEYIYDDAADEYQFENCAVV